MEKLKLFGCLFLALLACFTIGLYASSEFRFGVPVEPHRWIMTTLFGIFFLVVFLIDYRKN